MRRENCPVCGTDIHFENHACLGCGRALGFATPAMQLRALDLADDGSATDAASGAALRRCANRAAAGCNWLVPEGEAGAFCHACRHNLLVPADIAADEGTSHPQDRWREIEAAKRRLFYAVLRLGLPHATRTEDPETGLGFRFLADTRNPDGSLERVMTGHDNGVITLNIGEADEALRNRARMAMGEPYRTLIGHLRHEIGHYYWDRLVRDDPDRLAAFRDLFGDDSADYAAALRRHYTQGPPPDWAGTHLSAYATAHPWEDFAETWAHFLHMIDSLETAASYGLSVDGLPAAPADPYDSRDAAALATAFVPLSIAVNAVNRAMGLPDIYPFLLNAPALRKLGFVASLCAPR